MRSSALNPGRRVLRGVSRRLRSVLVLCEYFISIPRFPSIPLISRRQDLPTKLEPLLKSLPTRRPFLISLDLCFQLARVRVVSEDQLDIPVAVGREFVDIVVVGWHGACR